MRERTEALIHYIEEQVVKPEPLDDDVLLHLFYVKSMLKQSINSEDSIHLGKIYEALQHLESIKVEPVQTGFFGRSDNIKTMGEIFAQQDELILPQSERLKTSYANTCPALPRKYHRLFGPIHHHLIDCFADRLQYAKVNQIHDSIKAPPPVWSFSYPIDETGEIMNQAIGQWQADRMLIHSSNQGAYVDFNRDFGIHGLVGRTAQETDQLIEHLVTEADYSPTEKERITTWLKENGGQDTNRFFDLLLASGAYTNDTPAANLTSVGVEQNWTTDENGKIVFNYDMASYALNIDGGVYVNTPEKRLQLREDVENIPGLKKTGSPLLQVRASIQLNFDEEGNVQPRIVKLNLTSFNTQLSSPERLYVENRPTQS